MSVCLSVGRSVHNLHDIDDDNDDNNDDKDNDNVDKDNEDVDKKYDFDCGKDLFSRCVKNDIIERKNGFR